jgi:hypothetical protein
LIFHHLGGGSFSISPIVIPLFVLSIIYFNTRPLKEFSGPGLAATLVIFQLLGHFVFHDGTAVSDERMFLSHGIAVVITYFVARYFDKISTAFQALIEAVLPKVSFKIFILKFQQFFVCVYFQDKTLISMIFSVLRDRAPPAFSRA